MNVQIAFDHWERLESLEVYVDQHITAVLEKFGEDQFTTCRVRLSKCNSKTHTHRLIFSCEVSISTPRYSAIHIHKKADDIHIAIHEVAEKLNNLLSREHKSLLTRRHQEIPTSRRDDADDLPALDLAR